MPSIPDSVRLFLCARCKKQVIVCRQCDRNQIYCEGECREIRRRKTVRKAAETYQATDDGALNHAERQERYRHKKAKRLAVAAPPEQDQNGDQESGSGDPVAPQTRDLTAPGLNRGPIAFSESSSLDKSSSIRATGGERENDNLSPVATLSEGSGCAAAPAHQSCTDRQGFSAHLKRISLEDEGSEKIVTHHTSPEDADGVRLCALACVAHSSGTSAGRSAVGSTPRKPRNVSHCHFCGRPASGFVRFGFLGSMEVP